MACKVGKIKEYSDGYGEIMTSDAEYFFISEDNVLFKKGDLVSFRPEVTEIGNKAFFVKKITPEEIKQIVNSEK